MDISKSTCQEGTNIPHDNLEEFDFKRHINPNFLLHTCMYNQRNCRNVTIKITNLSENPITTFCMVSLMSY